MTKFTVAATMSPPYWKADKSCRLTFHTSREIKKEELLKILDSSGSEGWLLWSPNEMRQTDIPTQDASVEGKTPAERLRNVLYVLHKQSGSTEDFTAFYNAKLEELINRIKEKLL